MKVLSQPVFFAPLLVWSFCSCGGSDHPVDSASQVFAQAIAAHESGDYETALSAYAQTLELDGEHQGAWLNRSFALMDAERYEEALEHVDAALRLAPDDVDALLHRADLFLVHNQPEFALENARRAIELDPTDALAFRTRGDCWADLGEGEAAVIDYSNAIRLQPDAEEFYIARAMAFETLQQPEEAAIDRLLAELVWELHAEPDNVALRLRRAQAFLELGEAELALADTQILLEQHPEETQARLLQGHAHWILGDQENALAAYTQCIQGQPAQAAAAHLARASVYQMLGADSEAASDLRRAWELEPADQEVWADLAWLLATSAEANVRDGEAALELALALGPNAAEPWRPDEIRAAAYAATGQWQEAAQALTSARALAPAALQAELEARLALYRQSKTK